MDKQSLKLQLYNQCIDYVDKHIVNAQQAMNNATESGNDETKSSAGDKHETGRAMAQLEQEKSAKQLHEAVELKNSLLKISINQQSEKVSLGSLVITDKTNFYITIATGKMLIEDQIYFAISPNSPIGKALMGKSYGQKVNFNEEEYSIKNIL
jgi:transcription elongation GreA/GreB family factor